MPERLPITSAMHQRMVEVARDFRKEPTASEQLLWQSLRGRRLHGVKFRRQQPIGPFVVDFFHGQHALIVEVDGPIHDSQIERDRERQQLLEACGYRVLHVTARDVEQSMNSVLQRIHDHVNLATIDASLSSPPLPWQGEGVGG